MTERGSALVRARYVITPFQVGTRTVAIVARGCAHVFGDDRPWRIVEQRAILVPAMGATDGGLLRANASCTNPSRVVETDSEDEQSRPRSAASTQKTTRPTTLSGSRISSYYGAPLRHPDSSDDRVFVWR
jgi:hypothetical protein